MSTVTDSEKCPQCGGVYMVDFDCRTFEEYKFCCRCGKSEDYFVVLNDDGEPVLDENGELQYLYKEDEGYGCFHVVWKKGGSSIYSLHMPFDFEEIKEDLFRDIENPDVDKDRSYFTYWDAEKKEIVVLFGEDPGTYEEFEKEIADAEREFELANDQEHIVITEEDIDFERFML